jgi:hypothetical protein
MTALLGNAQERADPCLEKDLGTLDLCSWRTTPAGQLTDRVTYEGKKTIELAGNASPDVVTAAAWQNPDIRLLAGQRYTVAALVKTENASAVSLAIDIPQEVHVEGLRPQTLTGSTDWKLLEQTFTVGQDVQPRRIAVQLAGPGRAYVANFRIRGRLGQEWQRKIDVDPGDVAGALAAARLDSNQPVNWFTGRWPYISFLGGMVMGNRSEDLEFFYSEPFRWHSTVLDYVLSGGGKVYGLRATFRRYKEGTSPKPLRSFLLNIRTDVLLAEFHPSYILANGRRVWDFKKHKMGAGSIQVPFSVEEPSDVTIDLVVDQDYTPDTKGLAFRMFFLNYLGEPGVKVDLAGAEPKASGSPAERLRRFVFGLYPSGYDFWTPKGVPCAEIRKNWKANFRPDYPTDDVALCPFCFDGVAKGKYHEFMISYGGCNVAGNGATAEMFRGNPYLRGALSSINNPGDARRILAVDPKLRAFWFRGEGGSAVSESDVVRAAKRQAGSEDRVTAMYEPFPPTLNSCREYERGSDLLILKNEEDPQANIMMAMGRGAGRTFGKPFGFYWEQTHYPFPSLDEKLHVCMLYYLSGGSWMSAELDEAPSLANDVVAEWVYPLVEAMRFAMVHPARGRPIVPVGIVHGSDDAWWIPYNPFGQMDTFQRYIGYDHATGKLTCEPAFTKIFPWMPQQGPQWEWRHFGHLALFIDRLDELQGYNLLDVFFPKYGDAYTAHITRLLTGTPYGPVDFVLLERATPEHLRTFGVLAVLGKAAVRLETETKLADAAGSGAQVIVGVQHFPTWQGGVAGKPFGLTFRKGSTDVQGPVTGMPEIFAGRTGHYSGALFSATGDGWETVASVGDRPLVLRKPLGKGMVYVYLGRWMWQGADALRGVLACAGRQAAPLAFDKPDDQLEYVAYRKNRGAWVAVFNHGNIVIGCDRLDPAKWRVPPPEPLFTTPRGPYRGTIEFRPDRMGLDPSVDYALYQVLGIDGQMLDGVVSGRKTFEVKDIAFESRGGVIRAAVQIDKRAEYVIAPRGEGKAVFFGKP